MAGFFSCPHGGFGGVVGILLMGCLAAASPNQILNVRNFGAVGDGVHLDSPAINRAIDAASAAGGADVFFSAGRYLCGSIHLQSRITLRLGEGAVIVADKWNSPSFDPTEPFIPPAYQDGGHTFLHNSLIWGENLTNVSIVGAGMIDGSGLTTWQGNLNKKIGFGEGQPSQATAPTPPIFAASKAIALKNCKQVVIKGITILKGGWFAILATSCDDLKLEDLAIDTDRDGMDLDCCHNVVVRNCRVNSPEDDAICPKSTRALGQPRLTENLLIAGCQVSGFKVGTLLDGTRQPCHRKNGQGGNGRIKFGTESSGGFRNCVVTNCVFLDCMGFALEVVDGGIAENIRVSDLKMTNVVNYAIYLTTGTRNRTPNLKTKSRMKNILISNVTAVGVDKMGAIQIFGLPQRPLENIQLQNIHITSRGGGMMKDAIQVPKELGRAYPDPAGKPVLPAYGIFARHVRNLALANMSFALLTPDARLVAQFADIDGLEIDHVKAAAAENVRAAEFGPDVRSLEIWNSPAISKTINFERSF